MVLFSRKQHCELCHYSFSFTKVYRSDAPDALPPLLVAKRALLSLGWIILFVLRAILVAFTWVGVLPYATLWVWRAYWFGGDHFVRGITDLLLTRWAPHSPNATATTVSRTANVTLSPAPTSLSSMNNSATDWEAFKATLRFVLYILFFSPDTALLITLVSVASPRTHLQDS
jgi:hypothetical protein